MHSFTFISSYSLSLSPAFSLFLLLLFSGQTWWAACLLGGMMPFGAVFVEFYIILNSIWLDRYYYVFGFLFVVFIIVAVTCAEVAIVMCYFQLCSEDYRWWWRSMITPGFSAVYLFLYALYYFFTSLTHSGLVPTVLYFGYCLIAATMYFLVAAFLGFMSCFWFTRQIYSAVKVD